MKTHINHLLTIAAMLSATTLCAQNVTNVNTSTDYATIDSAITAVATSQTLALNANTTAAASITIGAGKSFTIVGNNNTITAGTNSRLLGTLPADATLTFQNLTLAGSGSLADRGVAFITAGPGVTSILGSFTIRDFISTNNVGGAIDARNAGNGPLILGSVGGTVAFINNSGGNNGGAIAAFDVTFNADSYFSGNRTTANNGAAVSSATSTFVGNAVFVNNSAFGQGGGILSTAANGKITFNEDAEFRENTALGNNGGGGIRVQGAGGAIQADGNMLFVSNTARGNAVTSNGGAINSVGSINVDGIFTATANYAGVNGGAIWYTGNGATFNGGSKFVDNVAGGLGGAIYWANTASGTIALNANTADITFKGNTSGTGANTVHNAIYILQNSTTTVIHALELTATTGKTIAFYDPIVSSGGASRVNVNISGNGGTVLFDTGTSAISALTTVNAGATLRLANNAIYGANTTSGTLSLKSGATLTGAGTVKAASLAFDSNALIEAADGTLTLDIATLPTNLRLAGNGTIAASTGLTAAQINVGIISTAIANSAQTLTIASTPLTLANNGIINIDLFANNASDLLSLNTLALAGTGTLNLIGSGSGNYKVLYAGSTDLATLGSSLATTVNGRAPSARYTVTPTYQSANHELWVNFITKNLDVLWTGVAPGSIWKNTALSDANWNDSTSTDKYFINGDRVRFDDTATSKNITIEAAGVTVADMTVANTTGEYTFGGAGGITSSTAASSGLAGLAPTGKLTKTGAGTLTLTNTGTNTFIGGIDHQQGVLAFTNGAQIGDGGKGITLASSATLRPNANGATFANKLFIAAAAIGAAIDVTASNTATHTGQITGVAGTTLKKTGAGTLILGADSSTSFAGAINSAAGSLFVNATGKLATVSIAPNATFGGAGSVTTLNTSSSSILQAGLPGAAGTLTIGTLNLAANSIISYNVLPGNQSSAINATTINLAGAVSTYTLNFTNWLSGTYALGNLTSLAAAPVTLKGSGLNVRQTYTSTNVGGVLRFTINPTTNALIVWTGTSGASATNGTWNSTADNWVGSTPATSTTVYAFADYDSAIFDDRVASATYRTVDIAVPITASDITVSGTGNYTFAGVGGITTATTGAFQLTGTGKLVKAGTGMLTFANDSANTFVGGIEIQSGTLAFSRPNQLGDGGRGINLTGDAALQLAAATNATLTNNITIAAGKTATIDPGARTLTLTGTFGGTGALAKINTGTLTLAASSSTYTGTINTLGGAVLLSNTATFGGGITLANNTTFGGGGVVLGTVNANAGSTIAVGETLSIANLHLANTARLTTASAAAHLLANTTLTGLVTADIAAGNALTYTGTITGSGTLSKIGAGSLIYTTADALGYKTTQLNDGILMFRGIAGLTTGTHTINLNGGWLDLSDSPAFLMDGSTANKWSGLNITGTLGGVIGINDFITVHSGTTNLQIGTAAKPGIFVVVDPGAGAIATLTGSNAYRGYTRVDSGILKVSANSQLGYEPFARQVVLNGGSLEVASSFNTNRNIELRVSGTVTTDAGVTTTWGNIYAARGAYANATPTGYSVLIDTSATAATFTKAGAGTLINNGFNAVPVININEGLYVATTSTAAGLATSTVTVKENATLEYRSVGSGGVESKITGGGTLVFTSSTLSLKGPNTIAKATLDRSIITLVGDRALDGAAITLNNSTLWLNTPNANLGALSLNSGTFGFTNIGETYRRASIASLDNTPGTLVMNILFTNAAGPIPAGTRADHFRFGDAGSATHTIDIKGIGSAGTIPNSFDLIEAAGGSATFAIPGGNYANGINNYILTKGNGDDLTPLASHWYLLSAGITNTGEAILNTASMLNVDWHVAMDSLYLRMGDLRDNLPDSRASTGTPDRTFNLWARGHAYKLDAENQFSHREFSQTGQGIEVGADITLAKDNHTLLVGMTADNGTIQRDFTGHGDGNTRALSVGVYLAWLHKKGWFSDLALKTSEYRNNFDVRTNINEQITGEYKNNIYGIALEFGRRFSADSGWWLEPTLQASAAWIHGANYTTTPADTAVLVVVDKQTSQQGRALVRVGHDFANSKWSPYAKAALAHTTTSGGAIHANYRRFETDYSGSRIEAGFGTTYRIGKLTQLYFDYEYAKSDEYERPWSVNLGIRHLW